MLKDVLREISESNMYSTVYLGKMLNISEEMVEELVGQLVRMGYLIEELGSPTCESKCIGCSVKNCSLMPIKMLSITEKGKLLLTK